MFISLSHFSCSLYLTHEPENYNRSQTYAYQFIKMSSHSDDEYKNIFHDFSTPTLPLAYAKRLSWRANNSEKLRCNQINSSRHFDLSQKAEKR